jgi:hypothetical protein
MSFRADSAQLFELAINGVDGLFEEPAVVGRGGAAEVVGGARA